jgi:hypothetical protein
MAANVVVIAVEIEIVPPDRFKFFNRSGDEQAAAVAANPRDAAYGDADKRPVVIRISAEALAAVEGLL